MIADSEAISWVRLALAFSVVFALLAGLGLGLRYIKARGLAIPGLNAQASAARLKIVETLPLDLQRRLVIVRCDDAEHLLLLGHNRDIVVDTRLGENQLSSSRPKPVSRE